MENANAEVVENKRIVLRIGINLGDVMVDGGDLYGDGVNIAARLEALAQPGSVHVSRAVYMCAARCRLILRISASKALRTWLNPCKSIA
jgi:class 3 adenylate cyclase